MSSIFFDATPTSVTVLWLFVALFVALGFEFVNGFNDTANAVATVIYTHTLSPTKAVVWSGIWNLIGVLTSAGTVAFGIIALLPVELVINVGSSAGFAMVFALLFSAILWNLGTWYFGLPASSSHTLVGAIMGVGMANALMSKGGSFGAGVNWAKASEVGLSLLVSPLIGFVGAAVLLLLCKLVFRSPELYEAPDGKVPPLWVRGLLILTCTGVSFAHGSNDGQKGMGLIMLILIGVIPATFAVNLAAPPKAIHELSATAQAVAVEMDRHSTGVTLPPGQQAESELSSYLKPSGRLTEQTFAAVASKCREIATDLDSKQNLREIEPERRRNLRTDLYLVSESLAKMGKQKALTDPAEQADAAALKTRLDRFTKFIPAWVKVAVALALGLGTMIGWKRIVVTVGEKIGKSHLTYAQGASAELVAMATIGAADMLGLPVSTTHVLSSGIAGTMAANRSGLQLGTLRNLLLAWVLTLPVCVLMGAGLFAFFINFVLRMV